MASADSRPSGGTEYSVHTLPSLDGVLLYVTLNGEVLGSWFGATEELATEAAAQYLTAAATHTYGGTSE